MKVLLIDNYDSFTYNLVQQLAKLGAGVAVERNDKDPGAILKNINPTHLVISPGPGNENDAGNSAHFIKHFAGRIPLLGVCLGLQVMGTLWGAKLVKAPLPVHGKVGAVYHGGSGVFQGLPNPVAMARYHSLMLSPESWPEAQWRVTARTADGIIIGICHQTLPMFEGVQFHPESFMSPWGDALMRNFLTQKVVSQLEV